jgi:hypothetical protein
LLILAFGVPSALILKAVSSAAFIRASGASTITQSRVLLLIPFFIGLRMLEGFLIHFVGQRSG